MTDYLPDRMKARATQDGLPADHPLFTLAAELDGVLTRNLSAWDSASSAPQLVKAWARARLAWCNHTGESLV